MASSQEHRCWLAALKPHLSLLVGEPPSAASEKGFRKPKPKFQAAGCCPVLQNTPLRKASFLVFFLPHNSMSVQLARAPDSPRLPGGRRPCQMPRTSQLPALEEPTAFSDSPGLPSVPRPRPLVCGTFRA